MRFKLYFTLENLQIPIQYRKSIISFFKHCLISYNETYYKKYYNQKDTNIKNYAFSVYYKQSQIQKENIILKDNKVELNVTTSDYETGIILYNAFNKQKNKKYPLQDNIMVLQNIVMIPEKQITNPKITIKFQAPLCVRHRIDNKDYYHSYQSKQFQDIIKINIKEQIKITVNGKEIITSSFKKNIKSLLDEKGIEYDDYDKITPDINDELKDYMQINIVKIDIKEQKEYEKVPFEITINEDDSLSKGETKVDQEGKDGEKEITYELIYEDGKLVEKNLVSEKVIKNPTDKVIKKGTKEEITVASRGSNSRQMSVIATAYATGTITSTGTKPKWGTIAVDPNVIPYGTKVYIPKFNMTFTAEDCGGAIKGNKIDIFMGSKKEAYSWGRRTIDIYILN